MLPDTSDSKGGSGIGVDRNTAPSLDAASPVPDALSEEERKRPVVVVLVVGFRIHIGQLPVLNGATP